MQCKAYTVDSGCRVEINWRVRLLQRVEELQKEIEAVGLGYFHKSVISKIATWKIKVYKFWIENNKKLVKSAVERYGSI